MMRLATRKVIRPFLCWFILSFLLLLLHYHQNQERRSTIWFSYSIEGVADLPEFQIELDHRAFKPGQYSGFGRKELAISSDLSEPFTTNVVVGYGGKQLGHLILPRLRGILDLKTGPGAKRIVVSGKEFTTNLMGVADQPLAIPTGHYKIVAKFAYFSTEREIEIKAHETTHVAVTPSMAALALSSNPTNSVFELTSISQPNISVRSNTPALVPELPLGNYQLRIWRGDYEQTMPVTLTNSQSTNKLTVEFDYGRLTLNSDPVGADVRSEEKSLGTTPLDLTLPAGEYKLSITKSGYSSTNLSLTLRPNEQPKHTVILANIAYMEALDDARRYLSSFSPDYVRSLEHVNKALKIKPDDGAALGLKRNIDFQKHLWNAREYQSNRDFSKALREIEAALKIEPANADALALKDTIDKQRQAVAQSEADARRAQPKRVYEDMVIRMPHQDLFPSQQLQFRGELASLTDKLVAALTRNPSWTIQSRDKVTPDVGTIQAELKGFGSRQTALLVLGQTAENEVTIHFKLWIYTLGNNIQLSLSGVSEDSYKPLHPSYASQAIMPNVERRRARELEDFKKRIENALP